MAHVRGRVERVKARLLSNPACMLVLRTIRELSNDDATHMAAGVAFYAILSLFPMTLGLVALLSVVLDSSSVQTQLLAFFQDYLPGVNDALETNINNGTSVSGFLGVLSFLGLFWSASAVFGAISRAVNRAWDVHQDRTFVVAKLRHITMALGVGLLFVLSVGATTAIQFLGRVDLPVVGRIGFLDNDGINIIARPLPFVFSFTIFVLVYKFVPNTPTHWRYIWPGVLLAAVAFEVSKTLFVFYLDNFANYGRVYGSLGSVVALLVWTYVSALILIVGAEFASEYGRMRAGVGQGRLIQHHQLTADPEADPENEGARLKP